MVLCMYFLRFVFVFQYETYLLDMHLDYFVAGIW